MLTVNIEQRTVETPAAHYSEQRIHVQNMFFDWGGLSFPLSICVYLGRHLYQVINKILPPFLSPSVWADQR